MSAQELTAENCPTPGCMSIGRGDMLLTPSQNPSVHPRVVSGCVLRFVRENSGDRQSFRGRGWAKARVVYAPWGPRQREGTSYELWGH